MSRQTAEKIEAYKPRRAFINKARRERLKAEGVKKFIPKYIKTESELKDYLDECKRKRRDARLKNLERQRLLGRARTKKAYLKKMGGKLNGKTLTDCTIYPDDDEMTIRRKKNRLYSRKYYGDALGRLAAVSRKRLSNAFANHGFNKNTKTSEMVGCSWSFLKRHIEKQFSKGMGWNNYGDWHIDHVIPLSSAKSVAELIGLSHFSNLQPMWAIENLSKGAKIVDCQPELLLAHE